MALAHRAHSIILAEGGDTCPSVHCRLCTARSFSLIFDVDSLQLRADITHLGPDIVS